MARLSTVSLLVCAASAVAATTARPQDLDDVTVAGRVSDQAGAAVSGARIIVTLAATGARREALTDDEGRYRLVELPPGAYSVRVFAAGFAEEARAGLVAVAGRGVRLDFTLRPAGVAAEQTVTAETDAALVDTARTVVGGTLTRAEIESLPVPSRAPLDLVFALPGVTEEPLSVRDAAEDSQPNGRAPARGAQTPEEAGAFALAGGAAYSNKVTTDGLADGRAEEVQLRALPRGRRV